MNLYFCNFYDVICSPISAVAGHIVVVRTEVVHTGVDRTEVVRTEVVRTGVVRTGVVRTGVVRTEVVRTVAGIVVVHSAVAGYLQAH